MRMIDKYLVAECTWQELENTDDEKYGLPKYKEPVTLKCFKYDNATFGKAFQIAGDEAINSAAKTYITNDTRPREGDLLDGQVIASVNEIVDFKGRLVMKECLLA